MDVFSHQLASSCQFLDVDIASNCVLKTRGAKTVPGFLLSCFRVRLDEAKTLRLDSPFLPFLLTLLQGKTFQPLFL